MLQETKVIGGIKVNIYGEKSDKVYFFIHGQYGNKEEAAAFASLAEPKGWQVLSMDLPGHGERQDEGYALYPWVVAPDLKKIWNSMGLHWEHVAIRANSIGAWFCLKFFQFKRMEKCLFVSPVLDMEQLILKMMKEAGVSEQRLQGEKFIKLDEANVLSWEFLHCVRSFNIRNWPVETHILYGAKDTMLDNNTFTAFAKRFNCALAVMEEGEHWFHTPEQLALLQAWEQKNI